jgi:cysteinyl-tRNA synthetase
MKPGSIAALKLRLTNTLTRKEEPFQPLSPEGVRMYHCGPTVIEPVNIDKFRSYLLGDVLRRYLEYRGLAVKQVMNITDVGHLNEFEEDAVEITASRSGLYPWELVEKEEKAFHQDRRALRILDAHFYPKAREHVPEMIELIERLLECGAAYRVGGNVHFDSSRAPGMGRLAGKSREELEMLQRSAPSTSLTGKAVKRLRHPLDFDLWRADPLHQMHWQSPWGRGFPGWHVECVVMGRKYLGPTFDIHSGSEENIFPHHECEIAEAEAANGGPLARYWLHSRHVLLEGKPISRSNRNLLTVHGLVETGVAGPEIRGALLSARFRERIEFRAEAVDAAREAITALRSFRDRHREGPKSAESQPSEAFRKRLLLAEGEFEAAMDDDLDVPNALKAVLRMCADLDPARTGARREAAEAVDRFDRVLGLL